MELFSVVVMRRLQSGQVSLQFKSKDSANNAMAKIRGMAPRMLEENGGRKHELLQDDFGNKVDLDPTDIGNICLVDVKGALEQSAAQAEMTNKINIELQEKARREQVYAQTRGGVLIPQQGQTHL